MGRIMAIDCGKKRIGIAVTDTERIIAHGLTTVANKDIWQFLEQYTEEERIERFVVGYPMQLNNQPSEAVRWVNPFIRQLRKRYPDIEVVLEDERFTSGMALQAMIDGGIKKNKRREKGMTDKISAALILQSYMLRSEKEI